MDVAVTGSTGLIGTALCHRLEADGDRVIRLVRRPVRSGEAAIRWDPAAGTIDAASLEGVGAVVHLAGAGIGDKRWTPARKRELRESRTRGTTVLATALAGLQRPPRVLVSGSAIGYYGDRGDEVLTEQSPPGDDFLAGICTAWEAATAPAADAGVRVACVRTGIVLTPDGGALAKLLPLFRWGLGGRFGSGRQWWSWISLDDEVGALRHLLDHPVHGPVNLTAPGAETNRAFTTVLGQVLHRPTLVPVPAFGPQLVVGAELARSLLFTSSRVVPEVLTASGYAFAHPDLEGALRHLLHRPEPGNG